MVSSLLTAFFFALSAVAGQRLARLLGALAANFWRLLLALAVLAALTVTIMPHTVRGETFWLYFLSGVAGFGFGDVGLYLAYPRLGSRVTMIWHLSLATVAGAAADWLLLGTRLGPWPLAGAVLAVAGVVLALHRPGDGVRWNAGLAWASLAGLGQAAGAVISRQANAVAAGHGYAVPGLSQACQRAAGGILIAAAALWLLERVLKSRGLLPRPVLAPEPVPHGQPVKKKRRFLPFWLTAAALCGPVAGVSFMQRGLAELPAGIVMAVTATSPLVVMAVTRVLDKERPTRAASAGSLLAVAGIVVMCLCR